MTKLRSVLPAIASAAAVALFLSACHFLGVASAQTQPGPVGATSEAINWTNVLLGIIAAGSVVRTILALIAPRTKTLWDDRARDFFDEMLAAARGIANARGTTIVNVEQPKTEPAPAILVDTEQPKDDR